MRTGALALLGAVLLPSTARAQLPPAPAHEVEPSDEARKFFQAGVELLQDPDGASYEEAFKAFRRAYELSPSWKILGNLGLTALKIERCTEAIPAYERYLSAGGNQIDPSERAQIRRDIDVMKTSSGTVELHVKDGSAATISDTRERSVGGPVVNSYQLAAGATLPLQLIAGRHVIAVNANGKHATVDLEVQAGGKQDAELSFDQPGAPSAAPPPAATTATAPSPTPAPAPAEHGSSTTRTAGLVVGGVGVATLVGGAVAGLIGLKQHSDLENECPNHTCTFSTAAEQNKFQSDKDSLKSMGTVTSVLLIGGAALTAVGVTLFTVGGTKHEESVSLVTGFGPLGGSLAARGAF